MTARQLPESVSVKMLSLRSNRGMAVCACGHAWGIHGAKEPLCLIAGCACEAFTDQRQSLATAAGVARRLIRVRATFVVEVNDEGDGIPRINQVDLIADGAAKMPGAVSIRPGAKVNLSIARKS